MSLRSTNLNLIPVLRALLQEGSVTGAAQSVGLSQPATSHALARLRDLLGDQILVRAGKSMTLTPRARRMAQSLEPLCQALENLLQEPEFNPRLAHRIFSVAGPDYVSFTLGGYLLERLAVIAPNVSIRFVDGRPLVAVALASGDIDAAIVRWTGGVDDGLSLMRGYGDRMVGLVRRDHPLAGACPSAVDLEGYPQLRHQRNNVRGPNLKPWPDLQGRIPMVSTQFLTTALLVAEADDFTVVPKALADRLRALTPVETFELPGEPASFESCMVWESESDGDPAHRWFRGLLDEAVRARLCTTAP